MYISLLSDFSRVLLKPKDVEYAGGLNALHKKLLGELKETYRVFDYFELNTELLDFYKSLKDSYSVNLFTTDVIQNYPEIRAHLDPVFDNIFSANDFGLNKKESSAYTSIAQKLDFDPKKIMYVDDQLINVEAANMAGLTAIQFNNDNQKLIAQIKSLLI